jgi:phytanoyl-CoA hydroxylase
MLSKQQIEQYNETGAVVVPGLIDAFTIRRMNEVLAGLVEGSRVVSQHNDVYDLEPGHATDEPRVRRIKKPHQVHAVYNEALRTPAMFSALRDLLGPSARLYGSKINLKSPRYGSPVEWHQDWAFYPHTNDDVLAVGVMLDDTTVANGAMYVLPGTHKGPTFDHHDTTGHFCGAMDPEGCNLDFTKAVACEGPAGSCSFHHVRLVHGSAQNTSNSSRGLLLYEVAAGDAFPLMGAGDYHDFKSRLLFGTESNIPRIREAPVRMPLPPALRQGSIYESQTVAKRYFGFVDDGGRKVAG